MKYSIERWKWDLLLILAFVVGNLSCKPNQEDLSTGGKLEISVQEGFLSLSRRAEKKTIEVTSSEKEWNVLTIGGDNWLTLSKKENAIEIETQDNPGADERVANVLFFSGRQTKKLVLIQEGAYPRVNLSEAQREVNHGKGGLSIGIDLKGTVWSAKTNSSWVRLDPQHNKGVLHIIYDNNNSYDVRVAQIYFSIEGEGERAFTLKQRGRSLYTLPMPHFLSNAEEVRKFEFARGNRLLMIPDQYLNRHHWTYATGSDLFPELVYTIFNDEPGKLTSTQQFYKEATLKAKNPNLFEDRTAVEGVRRFLLDNDFVQDGDDPKVFFNKKTLTKATLKSGAGQAAVHFRMAPIQTDDYETLQSFPDAHKKVHNRAEMEKYEAEHQGMFSNLENYSGQKDGYTYKVTDGNSKGGLRERSYGIDRITSNLLFMNYLYATKSLALFEYKGEAFMTKEFMAAMKGFGFEYQGENSHNVYSFFDKDEKVYAFVRWENYEQSTTGRLNIQIEREP